MWYRNKEFWIAVVDAMINVIMLVLVETTDAHVVEVVQKIILYVQPIVLLIIGGLFVETATMMIATRISSMLDK